MRSLKVLLAVSVWLSFPLSASAAPRDGQHGFDFAIGKWKLHNRRLDKALAGSTTWYEFDCTSQTRKVWGGKANLDEMECDTPKGHIEGLTLRTYNAKTGEWSIYWGNSANGELSLPPVVGHFENGVGEFFDHETFQGRPILVRYQWSRITPRGGHFEQAFSTDEGKTWETNWINDLVRVD